ncbi:conserved exported hypothetical protein [Burkholderiales bacterium 8X]|nr:conserved exported hypothetical protein [Burkholderiales bacterium 8X]
MKKTAFIAFALTLAAAAATAQTTVAPASGNVGGQASTQSTTGVPNPTQRPDGTMPAARADVKSGARMEAHDPKTSMVPKGQASTVVNGQPNATPPVGGVSRAEVKAETRQAAAASRTGPGEKPAVPTNPQGPAGAVMGTPK